MTDVRPFRALRYDPARVDLGRVLVPPYDVIAPEDRAKFFESDPHSAIRLTLTEKVEDEASADYAEVRGMLDSWQRDGVLLRDAAPAFYALRQTFVAPDGTPHTREGFFGALHLEDYANRVVRPHERTLAAPKADRLKLLRASRANLSSIFMLYEDREISLSEVLARAFETDRLAVVTDPTGISHELAALRDPELIQRVTAFLAERPVVIADGHHRYETALAYRDEQRDAGGATDGAAPSESVLAYFANAFAPGSLLLPIHRLILKGQVPSDAVWRERLPGWESAQVEIASAEQLPELLERRLEPRRGRHSFAADDASGVLRIFSRAGSDELSVHAIHREVIEGVFGLDDAAVREGAISYPKSAAQTARDVRAGRGSVALYLNPLTPDDVFRVTGAGEVMPQKSTFFFPKLPTGLLFRTLEEA